MPIHPYAFPDRETRGQSAMSVDDRALMSYVDGELSPEQRAAIEAAIATNEGTAERVEAFRASCLPYRAAFESTRQPDLPESLIVRADELIRVSRNRSIVNGYRRPAALAASFAAGIILAVSALMLAQQTLRTAGDTAAWVRAAADYQALYGRETLANIDVDRAGTVRTLAHLRRTSGIRFDIPDLGAAGLTFKRIQQLEFHGHPLVQLTYLPREGKPVALCMLEDLSANTDVRMHVVDGMHTAVWRSGRLTYALLAPSDRLDLRALARNIASGHMPSLYSNEGMQE